MMPETTLTVRRARKVPAPAEQAWPLLASPAAWSLRPGCFSFGVALADGGRGVRVMLTARDPGGLTAEVFEVSEEVPGRSLTLRRISGPQPGDLVLCLSASPGRGGTKAAVTVRHRVSIFETAYFQASWQAQLREWVAGYAEVAAGRRSPAGDGLPAGLAAACTARHPAQETGEAVNASASVLVSGDPDRVWQLLRDPAVVQLADPAIVAYGPLPGMPDSLAGQVRYVIRGAPGGCLRASVIHIAEVSGARAILVRDVASGTAYAESRYQAEPTRDGTRLAITTRVTRPSATTQDLDAQAAALAGRYKTAIEARLK